MTDHTDNAWKSGAEGEEKAVLAEQHVSVLARTVPGCLQSHFCAVKARDLSYLGS